MTSGPGRRLTRRQAVEVFASSAVSIVAARTAGAEPQPPDHPPNEVPPPATHKPKSGPKPAAGAGTAKAAWLQLPPTPKLPETKRSGIATINGGDLFYAQFGAGPPVLLLHGGLANSNYWGHQIEPLMQNFSVIVMDTRGHGRSPVMSRAFGYGLFAQDVVGLLDFLQIPKAAVVGWSDGAITGLQLAMTKPDRVSRLFAFGANSSLDGLKANGARSPVFANFSARCKAEYPALSPHPERWGQLVDGLRVMWRTEPNFTKQQLGQANLPTAISDGEYDEIIKRDHTEMMARAIRDARLLIQPGVSHFAMLQNPAEFNAAMMEFLTATN
jgi:pimeloyl-ACP methyl ester carboxylesterase